MGRGGPPSPPPLLLLRLLLLPSSQVSGEEEEEEDDDVDDGVIVIIISPSYSRTLVRWSDNVPAERVVGGVYYTYFRSRSRGSRQILFTLELGLTLYIELGVNLSRIHQDGQTTILI